MKRPNINLFVIPLIALLLSSCTRIGNLAERKADQAAYGNIEAVQHLALGHTMPFTIDDEEGIKLRKLLEQDRNASQPELLSLADALAISIANSRAYQTRKESLFIQALDLTEVGNPRFPEMI